MSGRKLIDRKIRAKEKKRKKEKGEGGGEANRE